MKLSMFAGLMNRTNGEMPAGHSVDDSTMVESTGKYDKEFMSAFKIMVRDFKVVQ